MKKSYVSLLAIVLLSPLTYAQDKRLTMSGIVMDSQSHLPVGGATVSVVGNRANPESTDSDGTFILVFSTDTHEGEVVRIRVQKTGYKVYEANRTASPTIPLQLPIELVQPHSRSGSASRMRSASSGGKTLDSPSAIGKLSILGWQVQPAREGALQFSDIYKHISLRESAVYFTALDKPFNVSIVGAKSLDGVEDLRNAKNLARLEFSAAEFNDLSQLRALRTLTVLVMGQTAGHITDLAPLGELKDLKELGLDSAAIGDLTPLRDLINISTLSIAGTRVHDLSAISNFRHLQKLNLGNAPVSDLSPLAGIDSLTEMSMNGANVPSLSTLVHKNNLKTLSILGSESVDLAPVGQLSGLEILSLYIYGPQGLDISGLRPLKNLRKLYIFGDGFQQFSPVRGLDAINELTNLTNISLFGVQVNNLDFVANLRDLNEISVANSPLSDISVIRRLKSLKSVSLTSTFVVDISPLLDLTGLETLAIARTPARSDVVTELERRGVKIQK